MAKDMLTFPEEDEFTPPSGDSYLEDEDQEILLDTSSVKGYETLPIGKYPAVVTDWEFSLNQKDDSPQSTVIYTVTDGEQKNRSMKVWYDHTNDRKRLWVTSKAFENLGIPTNEAGNFRLSKRFFIGKACTINVVYNSYMKDGTKVETTQIKDIIPADEAVMQLAADFMGEK